MPLLRLLKDQKWYQLRWGEFYKLNHKMPFLSIEFDSVFAFTYSFEWDLVVAWILEPIMFLIISFQIELSQGPKWITWR